MSLRHLYLDLAFMNIYPDITFQGCSAYEYIEMTSSSLILRKNTRQGRYEMRSIHERSIMIFTPHHTYVVTTKLPILLRGIIHDNVKVDKLPIAAMPLSSEIISKFSWKSIMSIFENIYRVESTGRFIQFV